jgi:spore germination protein GerM
MASSSNLEEAVMASGKKNARNQETIIFVLMGLIIVGLIISGYFLFVKKILPELSNTNQQPGVVASTEKALPADETPAFIPDDEAQMLTLFFPQKAQDNFRGEIRKVFRKKMLTAQATQIVEELLKGPSSKDLYSAIPANTKLRGLFFDSGTFIVDLSRDFSECKKLGAAEQILAVYSLVNSLTEIDPKAKVKILVNGSEQIDETGHIDLSQTLSRLQEMIVEN